MIKILDLNKIQDEYEYSLKKDEDITIIPTSFNDVNISKKIKFVVTESGLNQKISFKAVVESDNFLDISITLSATSENIKDVKVSLDAIVLNIGKNNHIKVHPNLEIPQKNITFEHKLSIGSPNKIWINYLMSRGLSLKESLALILKSFLEI